MCVCVCVCVYLLVLNAADNAADSRNHALFLSRADSSVQQRRMRRGGGAERAWPTIYHSRRPEKDYKIMSCTYDVLATHPIATHHRCGVLVDNGELVQVHTHV